MIFKNKNKDKDKVKPHIILKKISTGLFLSMLAFSGFLYIEFHKNEDDILKTIKLAESTDFNMQNLEKLDNIFQYNHVSHNLNNLYLNIIIPATFNPDSPFYNDLLQNFRSMDDAPALLAQIKEKKTQPLTTEEFDELKRNFELLKNVLSKPLSSYIKKSSSFPLIERTINNQIHYLDILLKNEASFNVINTYRSLLNNVNFLNEVSTNPEKAWNDYFAAKHGKEILPAFEILVFKNKG